MTSRDAAIAATEVLRGDEALASKLRDAHRFAFIDEAQNLRAVELRLLQAIFGDALCGVTFAGVPSSATAGFGAPAPNAAFALAQARFELHEQHRTPLSVELACRALIASNETIDARSVDTHVRSYRGPDQRDEAAFIAGTIADAIGPDAAGEIALLMRSVASPTLYETALLERGVPVSIAGDWNVFADRRALDALALLWNVVDPFRHDWLLRTLGIGRSLSRMRRLLRYVPSRRIRSARSFRWIPSRPRPCARAAGTPSGICGWGGTSYAAIKMPHFPIRRVRDSRNSRELRESWLSAMESEPFADFASRVWSEGLAREGEPGSASERTQRLVLERLLGRLAAFLDAAPDATVADALDYAQLRAESAMESCEMRSVRVRASLEHRCRARPWVRLGVRCQRQGRRFPAMVCLGRLPLQPAPRDDSQRERRRRESRAHREVLLLHALRQGKGKIQRGRAAGARIRPAANEAGRLCDDIRQRDERHYGAGVFRRVAQCTPARIESGLTALAGVELRGRSRPTPMPATYFR